MYKFLKLNFKSSFCGYFYLILICKLQKIGKQRQTKKSHKDFAVKGFINKAEKLNSEIEHFEKNYEKFPKDWTEVKNLIRLLK